MYRPFFRKTLPLTLQATISKKVYRRFFQKTPIWVPHMTIWKDPTIIRIVQTWNMTTWHCTRTIHPWLSMVWETTTVWTIQRGTLWASVPVNISTELQEIRNSAGSDLCLFTNISRNSVPLLFIPIRPHHQWHPSQNLDWNVIRGVLLNLRHALCRLPACCRHSLTFTSNQETRKKILSKSLSRLTRVSPRNISSSFWTISTLESYPKMRRRAFPCRWWLTWWACMNWKPSS